MPPTDASLLDWPWLDSWYLPWGTTLLKGRCHTSGGYTRVGLLLVLYLTLLDTEVKTMMVGPPWAPGRAHNSRSGPSVLDPGSLLLPLHTTQGTATRFV